MKNKDEKKLKKDPRVRYYKNADGQRRYRVRFKKTISGKMQSFEKQGFESAAEAIEWADESLRNAKLYIGIARNVTVQEYYDQWIKRNIGSWRPDTYSSYKGIFERHILPTFGNIKLKEINRNMRGASSS